MGTNATNPRPCAAKQLQYPRPQPFAFVLFLIRFWHRKSFFSLVSYVEYTTLNKRQKGNWPASCCIFPTRNGPIVFTIWPLTAIQSKNTTKFWLFGDWPIKIGDASASNENASRICGVTKNFGSENRRNSNIC